MAGEEVRRRRIRPDLSEVVRWESCICTSPSKSYLATSADIRYVSPTLAGARRPGIACSIWNFARQPVQCPARRIAGSSFARSSTVALIFSSSASARWYPPTMACTGLPASRTACRAVFTTPAWLQPVKTTSPLPAPSVPRCDGNQLTLDFAREEPLVPDELVLLPFPGA